MADDGGEVQEIEMEVEEQEGTDQATPTIETAKRGDTKKQVKGCRGKPHPPIKMDTLTMNTKDFVQL